jgi:transposase
VNREAAFDVIQVGERKRFAMRGIALRSDLDAMKLRAAARASKNGAQTRRLLILASLYDGAARSEAAKLAGVTLQIVRDWVVRFNAEGPDGLIDRTSPGRTPILSATQRAALAAVESGPIPAVHGVVRWRIVDLCQWAHLEFGVSLSEDTMSRALRAMNYRKLTARPRHHARAEGAIEAFEKTSPRVWRRSLKSNASKLAT